LPTTFKKYCFLRTLEISSIKIDIEESILAEYEVSGILVRLAVGTGGEIRTLDIQPIWSES
jgi:hypothetical protein